MRRLVVIVLAGCLGMLAPSSAGAETRDSVTGPAKIVARGLTLLDVTFDVHSGPSGEDPNGTVSGVGVTCLDVSGNQATIGLRDALLFVEDNDGTEADRIGVADPPSVPTTCPDPAALLSIGLTIGPVTITDGNIVVHDAVADGTPPVLSVPSDISVNATSLAGTRVTYSATATDEVDPSPEVVCTPPSGSTFAIGKTTVSCTATDHAGNEATTSFNVTVRLPNSKDECKNGGWHNFGTIFKNQGDCVSFVGHHARQACSFERVAHGVRAFRAKYGIVYHGLDAMERCIRSWVRGEQPRAADA